MGRRRSIIKILQQFLKGHLVPLSLAFDLERIINAVERPSYHYGRTYFLVRGVGYPARQAVRGRLLLNEGAFRDFSQLKRISLRWFGYRKFTPE